MATNGSSGPAYLLSVTERGGGADDPILTRLLHGMIFQVLIQVMLISRVIRREGEGSIETGLVAGRKRAEDVKTWLDDKCQLVYDMFARELRALGITVAIYSEHKVLRLKHPDLYVVVDPFGGSKHAQFGFKGPAWSVISIFDGDRNPVLFGAVDISNGEIYMATKEDGMRIWSLDWATSTFGIGTRVRPSTRTRLGPNMVVSGYLGGWEYGPVWMDLMRGMGIQQEGNTRAAPAEGAYIYPDGGEHTGPLLVRGGGHGRGGVDFYLSPHEPTGEFVCYLACSLGAPRMFFGCINRDGSLSAYGKFEPDLYGERIPLCVAGVTLELVEDVVGRLPIKVVRQVHDDFEARYAIA